MNRRALAAAVLLLPFLASCGGGGDGATAGATSEFCEDALARVDEFMSAYEAEHPAPTGERYGGTVVVGSYGEISDGMNALGSTDYTGQQHQQFVNLMTLLRMDDSYQLTPYLAESWEVDNPDSPTAVTFHLRDDVYWHDGERTDAYDVEFTWLRMTDPETAFPNPAAWDYYVRGPEGVEVIDSFTVSIKLRPHAEYLEPWRWVSIMPEHLLEDVPPAELKLHPFGTQCPVGNGPFVFVSHRPQESWTFRANPAFPQGLGGRPFVDRYVYRVILEQTTLLTELLTENLDVYIAPLATQDEQIMAAANLEFRHFPFRSYTFVGWNQRRPQLADARVRRALTLATNRKEIIAALRKGYGVLANAGVPPFHWAYDETLTDSLAFDPVAARRLLDEAGWKDTDGDGIRENAAGTHLTLVIKYNQGNDERQGIAEIMQAQLREVGIDAQPQVVEWTTLLEQINTPERRDFDGVVMGWVVDFKIDDTDLFHSERIDGPYAWAGVQNPRIDALLDTLQLVVNREEAIPLWHQYQRLLLEEQPYTYFYFVERMEGINKRVQGVKMDVRGEWINIKDWWIAPDARRPSEGSSN